MRVFKISGPIFEILITKYDHMLAYVRHPDVAGTSEVS